MSVPYRINGAGGCKPDATVLSPSAPRAHSGIVIDTASACHCIVRCGSAGRPDDCGLAGVLSIDIANAATIAKKYDLGASSRRLMPTPLQDVAIADCQADLIHSVELAAACAATFV